MEPSEPRLTNLHAGAPASTGKGSLTGAAAAQAGYDYQVEVSILAALRLLLITKAASRLVLEPANEEDLEADLAPTVPGRVQPSATVAGGYKLVIQVKRRDGEALLVGESIALPSVVQIDVCTAAPASNDIPYWNLWKEEWRDLDIAKIRAEWLGR